MFYLKLKNLQERTDFIRYMKEQGIICSFHYVPLHSAPAGIKFGRFHGEDIYTTAESDRLVRLPMYYLIAQTDMEKIITAVYAFFNFTQDATRKALI